MNFISIPPLAVAANHLTPGVYDFDFNVVNLGVPGTSGCYVLGDKTPLIGDIGLWLRFIHKFASSECDVTKSIMLGKITSLRVVGGTIVGSAHIYEHMRSAFDEVVTEMDGLFNSGIAAEIQCTLLDRNTKVNKICSIIGSMFLLENGQSLSDTSCELSDLVESIKHRPTKPPKTLPTVGLPQDDFHSIMAACGYQLDMLAPVTVDILRRLYKEAISHYRVNPMLIGGKSEKPTDGEILPANVVYIKNQIIKQLRSPKYTHATATCY